jgi:hypothetical protein
MTELTPQKEKWLALASSGRSRTNFVLGCQIVAIISFFGLAIESLRTNAGSRFYFYALLYCFSGERASLTIFKQRALSLIQKLQSSK